MSAVLERPEINPFLNTWRDKPREQVAEELASYSLETKRIPDPYHFLVNDNGELISPTANCRVKDVVQTGSLLGQLEYQALETIEQWAKTHNQGAVVWVSPPYQGVYPTSKIIVSELEQDKGVKKLFNRAIVLDFDEQECLRLATDLADFSQNRPLLSSLNEIRANPIVLDTQSRGWVDILEQVIYDPALWRGVRTGEDRRAKEEAVLEARLIHFSLSDRSISEEEHEMRVRRMLGAKSGSCPKLFTTQKSTAFQVFSGSSLLIGEAYFGSDEYGTLALECDYCNITNQRPSGKLLENYPCCGRAIPRCSQ